MARELHINGMAELHKFLEALPEKISRGIVRGGLRAGANVIKAEAVRNVPVGQPSSEGTKLYGHYRGALRDSIRLTSKKRGSRVTVSVVAGGKSKKTRADVFYTHFLEPRVEQQEYGARPHTITAQNRKGLSVGGVFFQSVSHPGMKARPFMRPALDTQASAAIVAAAEYIKAKLAAKHGLDTADIDIGEE